MGERGSQIARKTKITQKKAIFFLRKTPSFIHVDDARSIFTFQRLGLTREYRKVVVDPPVGKDCFGVHAGRTEIWNAEKVSKTIQQPLDWADKNGINQSRIVMGEFGCHRYLKWCSIYMEDVLTAADEANLHWAFYTFRSDSWGGMDYELGSEPPSKLSTGVTAEEFWKLSNENRLNEIPRSDTLRFEPISRRLLSNKEKP